jgi:hypothetical protein
VKNYLVLAIKFLKPTAEFVITDDDYSTIKWVILEGEAPSKTEIDAAIKQVKLNEVAQAKAQAEAKAAAQTKLAALGLTVEDLQALGL